MSGRQQHRRGGRKRSQPQSGLSTSSSTPAASAPAVATSPATPPPSSSNNANENTAPAVSQSHAEAPESPELSPTPPPGAARDPLQSSASSSSRPHVASPHSSHHAPFPEHHVYRHSVLHHHPPPSGGLVDAAQHDGRRHRHEHEPRNPFQQQLPDQDLRRQDSHEHHEQQESLLLLRQQVTHYPGLPAHPASMPPQYYSPGAPYSTSPRGDQEPMHPALAQSDPLVIHAYASGAASHHHGQHGGAFGSAPLAPPGARGARDGEPKQLESSVPAPNRPRKIASSSSRASSSSSSSTSSSSSATPATKEPSGRLPAYADDRQAAETGEVGAVGAASAAAHDARAVDALLLADPARGQLDTARFEFNIVSSFANHLRRLGPHMTEVQALIGARGLPGLIASCQERATKNNTARGRLRSTQTASTGVREVCTAIEKRVPPSPPRNIADAFDFVTKITNVGLNNNQDPDAMTFAALLEKWTRQLDNCGPAEVALQSAREWASQAGDLQTVSLRIFANGQSLPFVRGELARVGGRQHGRLLELTVSHPHVIGIWSLSNYFFECGPRASAVRDRFLRWCAGILYIGRTTVLEQPESTKKQKRRKFTGSRSSSSSSETGAETHHADE